MRFVASRVSVLMVLALGGVEHDAQAQGRAEPTIEGPPLSAGCSGRGVVSEGGKYSLSLELPAPIAGSTDIPICASTKDTDLTWALTRATRFGAFAHASGSRAVFRFTPDGVVNGTDVALTLTVRPKGVAKPLVYPVTLRLRYTLVPDAKIGRLWSDEYRPGRAAGRIEGVIINPQLVETPTRDDGVFYIDGVNLDRPELAVFVNGKPAEILSRSKSGEKDVVKAKVRAFAAGPIMVTTGGWKFQSTFPDSKALRPGSTWDGNVKRLGHRDLPPTFFDDVLRQGKVQIGKPSGKGAIALLGSTQTVDIGGVNEMGLKIDIADMTATSPKMRFERGPGADEATVVLDLAFESDGKELSGSALSTVDVFQCDSFEVPKSKCASVDIACFGRAIGNAFKSSARCLAPSSWSSARRPGPNVALSGDIESPKVAVRVVLGPGATALEARMVTGTFSGTVKLSADGVALPMDAQAIQERLVRTVSDRLTDTFRSMKLGETIASKVQGAMLVGLSGAVPQDVGVTNPGALYVGFSMR